MNGRGLFLQTFTDPVPVTTKTLCAPVSGTVGANLNSLVTSGIPTGMTLRWLQGPTDVTTAPIAAGTYTPYQYNTS